MNDLILHGYWRSTATYRVRIALALKGLAFDQAPHDLRLGDQRAGDYLAIAPQGLVPALETGAGTLTQSLAILEWLEESYPNPPLLPADAASRAIVRGMAGLIACDIHPLNNLRVLNTLRTDFAASPAQINGWIGRWIGEGFTALETLVHRHGGAFAFGDAPSLADCLLIPQLYSARRFNIDLADYPRLLAIDDRAVGLPAFAGAHPDVQPDADRQTKA
ncbi:MAG TPA: maleylacetoacetate isomerase [Caulobacteraceae bacterium]